MPAKKFIVSNKKLITPPKKGGGFIVFDSLDGSGMSTQAGRLAAFLSEKEQKFKFGHTGVHSTMFMC